MHKYLLFERPSEAAETQEPCFREYILFTVSFIKIKNETKTIINRNSACCKTGQEAAYK